METNQDDPQEEVQQNQIAEYHDDIKQIELEGYELRVRRARNALFWAAGIILVWEIIALAIAGVGFPPEAFLIIAPFVIGFVLLGIWTKYKPYTAIIIGICLFFAYWALVVFVNVMYGDGVDIFKAVISAWWVKLLILVNLFRPLKDAKELQQAKEEKKF
jgi:hypothetical protein